MTQARLSAEEAARTECHYMKYKEGAGYEDKARQMTAQAAEESPVGISLNCRAGSSSMWVGWNHRITPCVMMGTPCVDFTTGHTYPFDPSGATPDAHEPAMPGTASCDNGIAPYDMASAWAWLTQSCLELPEIDQCGGCRLKHICQVCYAAAIHEKRQCGSLKYLCDMANHELTILKQHAKDPIIHKERHLG